MVPVGACGRNSGARGGTALFTDSAEYVAHLPGTTRLTLARGSRFRARLTWVELGILRLLLAREETPLLACVGLPAERAFVFFAGRASSPQTCNDVELRRGDIRFFGPGERFHRRTTGDAAWGSIALRPRALRRHGMELAGFDVTPPRGQIPRCVQADWQRLRRLHAEAIRIAETRLHELNHPQVVRALEQDLIWALVACLAASGSP